MTAAPLAAPSTPRCAKARASTVVVLASDAGSLTVFRGRLLQALAERGHRVIACAPNRIERVECALAGMGVEFRRYPLARATVDPLADLATLKALRALFREARPDVALAYTIKPVALGLLAARMAGVPERHALITGLGFALEGAGARGRMLRFAAERLYRLGLEGTRCVFFQNPDDLRVFERRGLLRGGSRAVVVAGSGVDLDAFHPVPLPPTPGFLCMTRLLRSKGVLEFIEAARRVAAEHPEARFDLIGLPDPNPDAVPEVELHARLADSPVRLSGEVDDVRPAIAAASVYVLPSSYPEGTPRSVLEAMAMGRAVMTTDRPGCRETVIHGRSGFLVPPRDVEALAAAMARFCRRPQLAAEMGAEGRALAERRYDVHTVNAAMLEAMGLA